MFVHAGCPCMPVPPTSKRVLTFVPFSLVPIIVLAMPFIEIAGFVIVGSRIGVLATLGLVVLSAVLGCLLLRVQGLGLLRRIREETAAGRTPDRELVHGAMMVPAAFLLIVPGFVTSIIGLILFIPFVRDLVWEKFMRGRMTVRYSESYGCKRRKDADQVIDLDPEDYTSRPDGKPDDDSPWRIDHKDQ